MKVIADYSDGLSLTWEDGAVTGAPEISGLLAVQAGPVTTTPEGPTFDAQDWRSSAYAFIAANRWLDRGEVSVRFECEGVPVLARPAEAL